MKLPLGATLVEGGVRFALWSGAAERAWVSTFDASGNVETGRVELKPQANGVHVALVPGIGPGQLYGFRADGPYDPDRGMWFDPAKLLMDPYAVEIDRPYVYDPRLAAPREAGLDTAPLMPKAVVPAKTGAVPAAPPLFRAGGLIYELSVRAFSMRHPDVPVEKRGTVAALAEPAVIAHLKKLGVSAVELIPVTAAIDERHLPPLGLTNAWRYNPVSFMALDPRLAPGSIGELRDTVAALRAAGIGVILDLVFNHTGESDRFGPTLSLRGLDNLAYYRHQPDRPGELINDTGTGNTIACNQPAVRALILDTLRHFVLQAGVDGFRFDLAPIMARVGGHFDAASPLLSAISDDPVLKDRVLIAEPWDLGPAGYRLGDFPPCFLEWNDRYRDDVRRFWRGDRGTLGALATRLAGSSDVFASPTTRTVNFIAAHDGMTLADMVRYERKHNENNGEQNRDGHNENFSWNNGVEGETADPKVAALRDRDGRALLATLFASRGTIMLTAGDEFGRTQRGNNNAYAQDNDLTWLDWTGRDAALEGYVAALSALRRSSAALGGIAFLSGGAPVGEGPPDVEWLSETGAPLEVRSWEDPERHRLAMMLSQGPDAGRLAVLVNGDRRAVVFSLPARDGFRWETTPPASDGVSSLPDGGILLPGRTVVFVTETSKLR